MIIWCEFWVMRLQLFSDQISGSRGDFHDRLQRLYELKGNRLVIVAEVYALDWWIGGDGGNCLLGRRRCWRECSELLSNIILQVGMVER